MKKTLLTIAAATAFITAFPQKSDSTKRAVVLKVEATPEEWVYYNQSINYLRTIAEKNAEAISAADYTRIIQLADSLNNKIVRQLKQQLPKD